MKKVRSRIQKAIKFVIKRQFQLADFKVSLEYPPDHKMGDYATGVAMALARELKRSPMEIGRELAEALPKTKTAHLLLDRVKLVKPGYLNMYLDEEVLNDFLSKLLKSKTSKVINRTMQGKKFLLEHTSANPIKTIHIGHLRNNFLGMSMYRIYRALGAKVVLDYIDNNRGTAISRAMIGYLVFARKKLTKNEEYALRLKSLKLTDKDIAKAIEKFDWKETLDAWLEQPTDWITPGDFKMKSDHFDQIIYSPGARAAEDNKIIAEQTQELTKAWEDENKGVRKLWQQVLDWSWDGYQQTLERLGSRTDKVWQESEHYQQGKEWVDKGLQKEVFKKLEDGAVITDLEKHDLSDTILLKSDGTSLYHTQDLALLDMKLRDYPGFDRYVWCVGKEQSLYFKQLFQMAEQLDLAPKDKLLHLSYGFIRLTSGKMSGRAGNIVSADDLMDEMKAAATKVVKESKTGKTMAPGDVDSIAEAVMLAALKYGFLQYSRQRDFSFDPKKSLSLSGDSGPYLQYVYARCRSIMQKSVQDGNQDKEGTWELNDDERAVLVLLQRLPEKLEMAARDYDPSVLAEHLHVIAQSFNSFYAKHKVIGSGDEEVKRLMITQGVANGLKFGMKLLGIEALERM